MLDRIRHLLTAEGLLPESTAVLVGVSGGLDSMSLLHALGTLGYRVEAAHVNYGLREDASEADEALVRAYCTEHAVVLHVRHADPREPGESLQAQARHQRYAFFAEVARTRGLTHVAVAHHRDDQAETLLLNLLRGSGVEGLAGMPPQRPLAEGVTLVRPFLAERRSAIAQYAEAAGVPWRRDATNDDPAYRRGALRRAVLPAITEHFGEAAVEHLAAAAERLQAYRAAHHDPELARRWQAVADEEVRGLHLDALRAQPDVWRQRLLLEGLRRWLPNVPVRTSLAEALEALLGAQVGRRLAHPDGTVWRTRTHLIYEPPTDSDTPAWPQPLSAERGVMLPCGMLTLQQLDAVPEQLDQGAGVALLDADALEGDLAVRPWRDGDRLQPLGMQGTKAVSDLLTDARVPPPERAAVCVVCDAAGPVWVVGHRLAHRARVRAGSRRVIRLAVVRREST